MKKRWMLGICAALLCLGPVSLSAGQIQTDEIAILEERAKPEEAVAADSFSGWRLENGSWICYQNGEKLTGFFQESGRWYYADAVRRMMEGTGWRQVDGTWYWVESSGALAVGWIRPDGSDWYYLNDRGQMQTGWYQAGGTWYYSDGSGRMLTGWQRIGGVWYYLDSSGAMRTGWQQIGGTWYYLDGSGAMRTGWQYVGNTWYYLSGSGAMQTGWQRIGGTWYYLDGSGAMRTGWQYVGNTWYYLNGSGAMQTGWQQIGGTWYYLDGSGAMRTGWQYVGNTWYYLNGSGAMQTGWQQIGGTWYYLNGSGAMLTGWQQIGGKWYYMDASGAMASNTWIDGYYVDESGAWIPGEQQSSTAQGLKVGQQTDQIVFVEVSGTNAKVWMEEKNSSGVWQQIFSTSSGRIGYNGLGKTAEGDGKTPRGVYSLGQVFGIQPDPGSSQPYLQVDSSHYWVGDSSSPYYNQMVSTRDVSLSSEAKRLSEHIVDYGAVYNYCVEIKYNASGTPHAGSAIFLHCLGRGSTGGCVAIPQSDLLTVIRRLHRNAKIVIGTAADIATY